MKGTVVVTDYGFTDLRQEEAILEGEGYSLVPAHCTTEAEVLELSREADAMLVQWAPVTEKVIDSLRRCKVIVRYGIGVDNVDLEAARRRSIPVCNVPDYCISEVADHTLALALSLARQLSATEKRMRKGEWKITPPRPMPAFSERVFATIGFGRIAREVLKRAVAFGFRTLAFDPYVSAAEMEEQQVGKLDLDEAFAIPDIISLHLPLGEETRHFVNAERLSRMKSTGILINTSRGGLVDGIALAEALQGGRIAGAGLDVFETEPLPADHPLWQCENAVLTSHTAWYSESSVPTLQRMAAEEVARALKGQALKNRVA